MEERVGERRRVFVPLSSVPSPLVPRGERMESLIQPCPWPPWPPANFREPTGFPERVPIRDPATIASEHCSERVLNPVAADVRRRRLGQFRERIRLLTSAATILK